MNKHAEFQKITGLKDREIAPIFGMRPPHWSRLKNRKTEPSNVHRQLLLAVKILHKNNLLDEINSKQL